MVPVVLGLKMVEETEIELQLRLDSDGRTTFDPSSSTLINNDTNSGKVEDDAIQTNTVKSKSNFLDYSSKTVLTSMVFDDCDGDENDAVNKAKLSLLDDLLFDCEISDCALLPRTFWMPSKGMKPRCALEQCALEIFHHHVPSNATYDPSSSGAEWWVQIRPSPPAGRYSMLFHDNDKNATNDHSTTSAMTSTADKEKNANEVDVHKNAERKDSILKERIKKEEEQKCPQNQTTNENRNEEDDSMEKSGICFHWDKDEDLRLLMGGSMYIHPHISTVTYLTSIGPPTIALNFKVNPFTGEWMPPWSSSEPTGSSSNKDTSSNSSSSCADKNGTGANNNTPFRAEAYISWPKTGKHLSFDGRFLHAAPADLMEKDSFENQIALIRESDDSNKVDPSEKKLRERRGRRVTFLVNIWLNYKPFNVNLFPDTMVDKLSKATFANSAGNNCEEKVEGRKQNNKYNKSQQAILFTNEVSEGESENGRKNNQHFSCDQKHIIHDTSLSKASRRELSEKFTQFKWPLGDCSSNETIQIKIPLDTVRNEMKRGGNIGLTWASPSDSDLGVRLVKGNVDDADKSSIFEDNDCQNGSETKRQRIDSKVKD